MTKRAAIYDPYLDTLGGGERYCLTVAECLLENGYQVDLFWNGNPDLITKAQDRFSLNLKGINLVSDCFQIHPAHFDDVIDKPDSYIASQTTKITPFTKLTHLIDKLKVSAQYDLFFFLSDGSVPILLGRQNLLHVQVPFARQNNLTTNIVNQLKLLKINKIITNSQFTQRFANKYYGKAGTILYPPVDTSKFKSGTKENIILSVGRFDNILNAKRQDVLIQSFATIHEHNPDWKLVLAGGSLLDISQNNYLHHLQFLAQGLPVEFVVNPKFDELTTLYSKSKIYWHAAGYEVDENTHPENTEHFGIVIVEAMAAGLVPVAIKKGGIPEIINDTQNGYLWQDTKELISKTQLVIGSPQLLGQLSQQATIDSAKFSKENFKNNFIALIQP